MMGSCYSGAPINYSSAHHQHSYQKKRSFKTNNLSRKQIPDSKEKTKKKKKISISEEGHSCEEQAFGWTDGKTSNTSFRRNETSFYDPPLIGTSIKTHSHVHTCLVNLWPRGRKNQRTFRGNIPIPFLTPFTPNKDLIN